MCRSFGVPVTVRGTGTGKRQRPFHFVVSFRCACFPSITAHASQSPFPFPRAETPFNLFTTHLTLRILLQPLFGRVWRFFKFLHQYLRSIVRFMKLLLIAKQRMLYFFSSTFQVPICIFSLQINNYKSSLNHKGNLYIFRGGQK